MILQRLRGVGDDEPMPKDDQPLPAAEIALIARWIDEGVRATPAGPPAPAPWVAPLTLAAPGRAGRAVAGLAAPVDRLVADYLRRHGSARAGADRRRALRAPRLPRSVGPAADTRAAAGVPRRPRPTSAPGWCGRCSPTTTATPSTGSRSGTTCSATRTASPTSRRTPAARASRRGCCRRCRTNLPYDRFVATLINPAQRRRPGRLRHRRQLARRDERRGDAVDAGGAEHVAGVPRRQPEVRRRATTASSTSGS